MGLIFGVLKSMCASGGIMGFICCGHEGGCMLGRVGREVGDKGCKMVKGKEDISVVPVDEARETGSEKSLIVSKGKVSSTNCT